MFAPPRPPPASAGSDLRSSEDSPLDPYVDSKGRPSLRVSFKRYFPPGEDVVRFGSAGVLFSRFPIHATNHLRSLFTIEKCIREEFRVLDEIGEDDPTLKCVLLLGSNFHTKLVVLNSLFRNQFADLLQFIHEVSFCTFEFPSYALRLSYVRSRNTFKVLYFPLRMFQLLRYGCVKDVIRMGVFSQFATGKQKLLEKYLGRKMVREVVLCNRKVRSRVTSGGRGDLLVGRPGAMRRRLERAGVFRSLESELEEGVVVLNEDFEDDEEEHRFFQLLKYLTKALKFDIEEVNRFLKLIGYILVLLDNNKYHHIDVMQLQEIRAEFKVPTGVENLRYMACIIHHHLVAWIVRRVNAVIAIMARSPSPAMRDLAKLPIPAAHFFLFPELPTPVLPSVVSLEKKKRSLKTGRVAKLRPRPDDVEDVPPPRPSSFADLGQNVLLSHLYVWAYNAIRESKFSNELSKVIALLESLNKNRFYLMKNLKMSLLSDVFALRSKALAHSKRPPRRGSKSGKKTKRGLDFSDPIIRQRWLLKEENVLEFDHPFGRFRYNLKSLLYRRRWQFEFDLLQRNLQTLFPPGLSDDCRPFLVFSESSHRDLLGNRLVVKFLLNRIIIDEKKASVRKRDVLRSIVLLQSVVRTREARRLYEAKYLSDRTRKLRLMREKYARLRLQRWWRKYHRLLIRRRRRSAIVIQRWYRWCVKEWRNSAARVIQYHCRQYLNRKVTRWMGEMLHETASILQRGWRRYKRTDEILQKREEITSYLDFVDPSTEALSLRNLLSKEKEVSTSEVDDDGE